MKSKYYLFVRDPRMEDYTWKHFDVADTKEECEEYMKQVTDEPINLEYMVIKGESLNYEEGISILLYSIIENEENVK